MNRSLKSAAILILSVAALANCSSSDKPATCPAGTETCACYGNGTCDPGLECLSRLCVASSSGTAGASAQGGQSGNASGGSEPIAGSAGAVAGGSGPSGGTGGQTGVAGGNAAGSSAAGSDACGDTSSDPMNCGQCGHVCLARSCQAGKCAPFQQGCFVKKDGFTTCDEYCASIGESCVSNKCGGTATAFSWASDMGTECEKDPKASDGQSIEKCDYPLNFSPSHYFYRCCCTDS